MSEAPAVIRRRYWDRSGPVEKPVVTEYVRKDIFDAYKAAVDAWFEFHELTIRPMTIETLPVIEDALRHYQSLMQAARRAGESVK